MTNIFTGQRRFGNGEDIGARWQARRAEVLASTAALLLTPAPRAQDREELARQAHRLAGCAGLFGEDRLGELAGALEDRLKTEDVDNEDWREDARALLAEAGFGRMGSGVSVFRTDPKMA